MNDKDLILIAESGIKELYIDKKSYEKISKEIDIKSYTMYFNCFFMNLGFNKIHMAKDEDVRIYENVYIKIVEVL